MTETGVPSGGEENRGWKLYITTLSMTIVAGLFVLGRCATRIHKSSFGPDDYAINGAMVFSVFTSIAVLRAIANGYGKHIDDLTSEQAAMSLKWFFIAQTPYKVTVCLNKVSMLLLYRRLFVQRNYRICIWTLLGIVVGWSTGAVFATILQCLPIEASWDKSLRGICIDKGSFWIAYAVGNILTDILVLGFPITPVLKLNMPLGQRLLLCGIFMLGAFVTITSILRTTAVSNSLKTKQDLTYNFITRGIWTLVECNTGIICACLPTLKQPIAWLLPRFFRASRKQSSYSLDVRNTSGSAIQLDSLGNPRRRMQTRTVESGQKSRCVGASAVPVESRRGSDEEAIMMQIQGLSPRKSAEEHSDGARTLESQDS